MGLWAVSSSWGGDQPTHQGACELKGRRTLHSDADTEAGEGRGGEAQRALAVGTEAEGLCEGQEAAPDGVVTSSTCKEDVGWAMCSRSSVRFF